MNLIETLQAQSDNHLTDLGPKVFTREEWLKEPHIGSPDPLTVPDIQVIWESNNDGYASIVIELWDIEDGEEERTYDAQFKVSNNDNVGPRDMLAQLQKCVEQFYALGLNTRFGHVIGDF